MATSKRATARRKPAPKRTETVPKAKAPVEKAVRPARSELPKARLRRFVDPDLLSQAAALAFYAVLSLAPLLLLLLLLLWIYYASLVVFIGALLTAVIDERQRIA